MEWKEVAFYSFVGLMPLAWIISSAVSTFHEVNRHKEQMHMLSSLRANIHANTLLSG